MPTVTIRYKLPDEQAEFDAARTGAQARSALWEIDQFCRNLLKHGESTKTERLFAEGIRRMIPPELLD